MHTQQTTHTPRTTTALVPMLAALGRRLADHGPAACETELRRVAAMAHGLRRGAALAVMLDRDASPVVRSRAFAIVCSELVDVTTPPAVTPRAA